MALESVTTVYDLVATNPTASDPVSQADDHLRNIKAALLASFAGTTGANGYQKIGRSIIQWGSVLTVAGTATATFPIAFPTGCRQTFASLSTASVNAPFFVACGSGSTTSMSVFACNTSGVGVAVTVKWLAIGD